MSHLPSWLELESQQCWVLVNFSLQNSCWEKYHKEERIILLQFLPRVGRIYDFGPKVMLDIEVLRTGGRCWLPNGIQDMENNKVKGWGGAKA